VFEQDGKMLKIDRVGHKMTLSDRRLQHLAPIFGR
jgi:hypothetical protein